RPAQSPRLDRARRGVGRRPRAGGGGRIASPRRGEEGRAGPSGSRLREPRDHDKRRADMTTLRFRAALPAAVLIAIALAAGAAFAQQLDLPRPSPNASVSQRIGITDVTVRYSSPGVKGRKIWGELVPYDAVWRMGANEKTAISFSSPVKVDGHELPAGIYGLQTIPTTGDWTLIFSKDGDPPAAFSYKPENDVLRIQVTPQAAAEPLERMAFSFENTTDTSSTVVLRWEKLRVPFTVTVDTPALVTA